MARVTTHKAKYDIYKVGAQIPDSKTKSGTRRNRRLPFDKNDVVFCPKSETYYTWGFRFGGIFESRTPPKPSQLTQSNFMSQYLAAQEQVNEMGADENIVGNIENIIGDLENIKEECQSSLDNMPDGLQQGSTGELLQNRVDSVDNTISELQSCIDDNDVPEELDDEDKGDLEEESDEYTEKLHEKQQEVYDAISEQLQGVSFDAE